MNIKYTKEAGKVLKAYAEFAEDVGDAITASLFPAKSDADAIAEIMQAHEKLKKKLKVLGYKPPERPWKKGVGRVKNV